MANVRDLLIRMSLDTTNYKTQIDAAKRELRLLKQEYAATASDKSLEDSAATLLANLQAQKSAIEAEIAAYQQGINTIKQKLTEVAPGSQNEQSLVKQAADLETKMKGAETALNNLESKISTMKMDNLLYQAQQLSTLFMSLKLGLGDALDFFGDAADSADDAFVRREAAFIQATKNVEDARQTKEDLDALNKGITEMATRIPQTYEQLAGLMGVGATLGVPYENLLEFTEVMAKLNVATNVAGEGGAQAMAQFLNITEKGYDNLARVGAALTELGNNSATTEQNILEMAHRASTGLSTVGMSTADILALSAALNSVGIEAQAGGSSISKLGITMDKAANVGATQIDRLLDAWGDDSISSIYDLYAELDKLGSRDGWRKMGNILGMTAADTKALMNSALAAERFSQAMGVTVDEFSQGWNEDAAAQMLQFFISLGEMSGETEQENMLWVMDQLGIKEIRQSNMVRALANNWELYAHMLTLGRNAYEENIALENEAQRAFGTTESQRAVNANKEENAAEAMGRSVAAMRQPWDAFFADLKQWYADWPTWAQNAVGGVSQTLGAAGDVLDWMGTVSFNALNIVNAIKMLKDLGVGAKLAAAAPTLGKVALGAGAVAGAGLAAYGLYELAEYLADLADDTDTLSATLAGLEIKIDPVSKEATLAAIKEVQDAADKLGGGGDMEKYANTSRVVQMGYGTASMFGQALAYEQYMAEQEIDAIYQDYGARIREIEGKMAGVTSKSALDTYQGIIESLTAEMERKVGEAQQKYGATVSNVLSGGLQAVGAGDQLETFLQKYSLLNDMLRRYDEESAKSWNYTRSKEGTSDFESMFALRMQMLGLDKPINIGSGTSGIRDNFILPLYESMIADAAEIFGNGDLMTVAMAALQSGALENADQSQYGGAWMGLLQAMDLKAIADKGPKEWTDIGKNSMLGLGQGIDENKDMAITGAETAADDLTAAARRVLGINSPSTVFFDIGENIDQGLANGIYARADEVIAAASWLAGQVEATMRAALDINSPSGVARRMGVFLGEGLAQGIEGSLGRVERAAGNLANGVSAAGKRPIDVTLNLDGRTLTEIMVPMMDQALGESMYE